MPSEQWRWRAKVESKIVRICEVEDFEPLRSAPHPPCALFLQGIHQNLGHRRLMEE